MTEQFQQPAVEQNQVPPSDSLLIKIQILLSENDYIHSNRMFVKARNRGSAVFTVIAVALLMFTFGSALIVMIADSKLDMTLLVMALPLLLLAVMPLIQRTLITSTAKNNYRKTAQLRQPLQEWIFNDRLEEIWPNGRTVFLWTELEGAAEDGEMILLWSKMQMMAFPAHALNPSAAAYLHNLLLARLGTRFRVLAPIGACGMLEEPAESMPFSPLHGAISAATDPQSSHELPPYVVDLKNRASVSRQNIWISVIAGCISGLLIAALLSFSEYGVFEIGSFLSSLLLFWVIYTVMMTIFYRMMMKRTIAAAPLLRLMVLPSGFGMDTGRSSVITPWEKISVWESGTVFRITNADTPTHPLEIKKSELSAEGLEELRRLLIHCCGANYNSKNGIIPR